MSSAPNLITCNLTGKIKQNNGVKDECDITWYQGYHLKPLAESINPLRKTSLI